MTRTKARASRGRRLVRPQIRVWSRLHDVPTTPDLQKLRGWWDVVEGAFDMGMTPEGVIELIGPFKNQVLVTEVIDEGHDYKNAVVGAYWQRMHGKDVTNTLLSHYPDPEVRYKTRFLFNKIIVARRAMFLDTPPIAARRVHRSKGLEMAFLPLRDRNGKVSHLITAVPHYQSIFGTR